MRVLLTGPTTSAARGPREREKVMYEYGCCRCQTYHREGEAVYAEHIMWQSKHGPRWVSIERAIIEAAAVAHFKCEKAAEQK